MPAAAMFFCIGKRRPINRKMKATRTRSPGLQKAWPRARYCAIISPGILASIKPQPHQLTIWPAIARAFSCPLADLIARLPNPIAPAKPQSRGLSKIVKQAGPRPATSGQTYRARDPRADIDVRFHRPAGPRRAENLPAADQFRPQFSPSWPQFLPAVGPRSAINRPGKTARVPRISGQKTMILNEKTRSARRGPPRTGAGARAMFLSNIYIKFRLAYNYPIKGHIIP